MTASPAVAAFTFETSYDPNEVYRDRGAKQRTKLGLTEDQFFVAFGLLGGFLLFWRYTIALGATMLAVTAFLWAIRERSHRNRDRLTRILERPERIYIRVTESGYTVRAEELFAETSWNRVINGFETNGYLLVQSRHMPRMYLSIAELREAGLYDRIKAIVDARSAERQA